MMQKPLGVWRSTGEWEARWDLGLVSAARVYGDESVMACCGGSCFLGVRTWMDGLLRNDDDMGIHTCTYRCLYPAIPASAPLHEARLHGRSSRVIGTWDGVAWDGRE